MKNKLLSGLALSALIAGGTVALAQSAAAADYEITITNATRSQPFAPSLVVIHDAGFSLFAPGDAPTFELATLAETGDPGPLQGSLPPEIDLEDDTRIVTGATPPLLQPFESTTFEITSDGGYLSAAAMLIATNDGFYGVRGVKLPDAGSITVYAPVYDAGSEENNERNGDVPATNLGNSKDAGTNAGDGEGFIHIHPGIFGVGQLKPVEHDWNNPVAAITITKLP